MSEDRKPTQEFDIGNFVIKDSSGSEYHIAEMNIGPFIIDIELLETANRIIEEMNSPRYAWERVYDGLRFARRT